MKKNLKLIKENLVPFMILIYILVMPIILINNQLLIIYKLGVMENKPPVTLQQITPKEAIEKGITEDLKVTPSPEPQNTTLNQRTYSDDELDLLARLLFAEASIESSDCQLAIGSVIMNRIESSKFPSSLTDVIYEPGQFSVISSGAINNKPSQKEYDNAKLILEGKRTLPTGVLFFYANSDRNRNSWIGSRKIHITIDHTVFAY